jgi:ABC-type multidrug transport system fused ATPase/permease subunit
MPKINATCFISYCHDDTDFDTLEKLEEMLGEASEHYIKFIRDDQNPVGGNWDDFMSLVESVDAAILLLSPAYKTKVMTRSGGVYREFRQILLRHARVREARQRPRMVDPVHGLRSFRLIPILFSGSSSDALPNEISREHYFDFTHFHVAREEGRDAKGKKQLIIANSVKSSFQSNVRDIISRIDSAIIENIPDFHYTKEKYFDLLMSESKDENLTNALSMEKRNYIFVKTSSYKEIRKRKSYIIVGRKGSGKSTITRYISEL